MKKNKVWKVIIVVFLPVVLLAQTENWVYRYNGPGNNDDWANCIVYGTDGNLYAAGCSYIGGGFTVISLTTDGDTNWVYRCDEGLEAYSIVYGSDGNIYAAGYGAGGNEKDFIITSLTTAGDTNWVYRYDGPSSGNDVARCIVYGADGNLYAAGSSDGTGPGSSWIDLIVISLTTAGDTNWVYRYDGSNNSDGAWSIVYGLDGNLYVAGWSCNDLGEPDMLAISLTTAGNANWVYRYNGPAWYMDEAYSIAYGSDGNIYVAGTSYDINHDFTVISFTATGDTNWAYRYNGPGNGTDMARCIVYGAEGNIYAAGYSYGNGTYEDFTVISLTTAGDTNWIYRYDGPGNLYDRAYSIIYGAEGNIYAVGYSYGSTRDFTVISLTTDGDTNWVYQYNGPGNGHDIANSIIYGADGNLYAAGSSEGSGTGTDFTVISLSPDLGMKEENAIVRKNSFSATILSGPLQLPKDKTCKVFDITGRAVMPNKIKPGIYFIEVDGVISHKIIKVK